MEILENYIESDEEIEFKKNVFKSISKDLSSVIWVSIVLILIIWSYIQAETVIPKNAKLDMYKLSITQEFENNIN